MKRDNLLILKTLIVDVLLVILAGFLCWYFHTLWGLLALIFMLTVSNDGKSDDNDKKEDDSSC